MDTYSNQFSGRVYLSNLTLYLMKMSQCSSSILPNLSRVFCIATIQKTAFFFSHILQYSLFMDVFERKPMQCLNPKNVTLSVRKVFHVLLRLIVHN